MKFPNNETLLSPSQTTRPKHVRRRPDRRTIVLVASALAAVIALGACGTVGKSPVVVTRHAATAPTIAASPAATAETTTTEPSTTVPATTVEASTTTVPPLDDLYRNVQDGV